MYVQNMDVTYMNVVCLMVYYVASFVDLFEYNGF